jgi:hypothetical protein
MRPSRRGEAARKGKEGESGRGIEVIGGDE